MRNRPTIITLFSVFVIIILVALTGCTPRSAVTVPVETRTLHLGHIAPAGTAFDLLAHRIKDYVETESDGRYNVLIYSDATLGHQDMLIDSMMTGTVDIAIVNNAVLAGYVSNLGVLDLPFLFSDWDEVNEFLHSDIIEEIYAITDVVGISTLAFMPRGFRHVINNIRPIYTPSDFHNLSIRVMDNDVFIDTFNALGANPVSIPWEDTLRAVAEGRVDGKENTIITINDYSYYEIQRYLSLTGHFFAFAVVMASPITLNTMPLEDQDIIRRAAFNAALSVGAEQLAAEYDALENLRRNGMQVNDIPDKQPFIDMMQSVYDSFFETHDREYYEMIRNAIR